MSLPKLFVGALVALPLSGLAAQSTQQSSSDDNGNRPFIWVAAAGASGAALFTYFAHSGNGHSGPAVQTPALTAPNPPAPSLPANPGVSGNTNSATTPPSDPPPPPPPPPPPGNVITDDVVTPNVATVPEPSSIALLATGIVGLAPMLRRRKR